MEIHEVIKGRGDQVIFYVHGFMPSLWSEFRKNNKNITDLFDTSFAGSVYFVDWDSTGFTKKSAVLKVLAILSALPSPIFKFLRIPAVIGDFIIKFEQADKDAKRCGLELLGAIKKTLPWYSRKKIYLIGHSLGSKVIHESLLTGKWSKINLWNVVYLASAVKRNNDQNKHNEEFGRVLSQIRGKLFNFYSYRDLALKVLKIKRIGLERIIGINKKQIEGGEKIVDINSKLRHIQYTKQKEFRKCMEKMWDKGEMDLFF